MHLVHNTKMFLLLVPHFLLPLSPSTNQRETSWTRLDQWTVLRIPLEHGKLPFINVIGCHLARLVDSQRALELFALCFGQVLRCLSHGWVCCLGWIEVHCRRLWLRMQRHRHASDPSEGSQKVSGRSSAEHRRRRWSRTRVVRRNGSRS